MQEIEELNEESKEESQLEKESSGSGEEQQFAHLALGIYVDDMRPEQQTTARESALDDLEEQKEETKQMTEPGRIGGKALSYTPPPAQEDSRFSEKSSIVKIFI